MSETPNTIELKIEGRGAAQAFSGEAGGHRFQRVPPTEKRGRVHTSTVTVAIVDDAHRPVGATAFDPADVTLERYKGGKGGQHQNKHANNVRATHRPSGTTVQVEGRHFHRNRDEALQRLRAKLDAQHQCAAHAQRAAHIAAQVGSGMRGDKRRTVALQRDQVVDHQEGWTMSAAKYLRGDW